MRRTVRIVMAAVLVLVLAAAPVVSVSSQPAAQTTRPWTPERVPDEVLAAFGDGMTIDEFIVRAGDRVPQALAPYLDRPVAVVIEMEQPSLAAMLSSSGQGPDQAPAQAQQTYTSQLLAQQASVISTLTANQGAVLGQYTKVYNGILARLPAKGLQAVRSLPGVKQVHPAPVHYPTLSKSIPLIKADQVWDLETPFTGSGVRIAVIDTGVDYTHAAFGGPGTEEAYNDNDPDVIEEDTFPTEKVIGGYDFAGTDYTGEPDSDPEPDPDPLDENGHGTHVASTAAGMEVPDNLLGKGVAPDALIYALKVFGRDGSTNLTINALEWAMDPNGDGDVSDRVDVVNMSLGSDFGPFEAESPELVAVDNLTAMGVVVVASSGNAGGSSYVTGTPAGASTAIAVAASTTGWLTAPYMEVEGYEAQVPYQPSNFMSGTGAVTEDITAPLGYAGDLTGAEDDLLCDTEGIPSDALDGEVALIQRGVCNFTDKINNAADLGAVAAIVFNDEARGDDLITMGDPAVEVDIPAVFIGHTHGAALTELDGADVTIWLDKITQVEYGEADTMADFTSLGPRGYDTVLKPDVTAPGVSIFAARMGSGDRGTSMSGTSMASPHVAGVAALVRQAHPDWTAEMVKAAIMNTSVQLEGVPATSQGAGRVDALASVQADTLAVADRDLVAMNWGFVEINSNTYSSTRTVEVRNLSSEAKTYTVDVSFTNAEVEGAVITAQETSVTVGPGESAFVPVQLDFDATVIPLDFNQLEEFYGFIILTNTADAEDVLRLPFYASPRPYTRLIERSASTEVDPEEGYGYNTVTVELEQRGPQPSLLQTIPAYIVDPNETEQRDAGDLRLVGTDSFEDPDVGDLIVMAFNTWGPIHVPQPYFVEHDMALDVDDDPEFDLVNFNYNLGAIQGLDPNNDWVVIQVDLDTLEVSLASPFLIYSDYNAGYQEWYLPPDMNGLSEENSEFAYTVTTYDWNVSADATELVSYDYLEHPVSTALSDDMPHNSVFTLTATIGDSEAFEDNPAKGVMLVDYTGQPGLGQVYFWPFDLVDLDVEDPAARYFLPSISK